MYCAIFFALLHVKSDSCVLIRFCGRNPALGSSKVVKIAPCKLQGHDRDSFMARENAPWMWQEGNSRNFFATTVMGISVPFPSFSSLFVELSYHCLLFPLRLFGLQGNVCHVLCICTMTGKAILLRAALPAVNALTPWFTLPLLFDYSVAQMQWAHLISCGCVFMLTHSEMSLSGHNGSLFCRWMNTLQSCIISFFHWTSAIQKGLYFKSENSYVNPFSSLFTYPRRVLKGIYFFLTASSKGVIKSSKNGRKRLLERHGPAEESPKERIKNNQMSGNMWFTGRGDINLDCLF